MARNVVGSQQRAITQEVASNTGNIIKAGFSLGQEAVLETHKANQESKLFSNMSEARIKINDLTNDYKVNNEGDPDKGLKEYQNKVNSIFEEYGKDFKGVYANTWGNNIKRFNLSNNISIKNWGLQQNQKNAISNMKSAIDNSFIIARQDGQKFGTGSEDISLIENYISSEKDIRKIGDGILGEMSTKTILKGYKSKYSSEFLSGIAETNPERAESLLKDEKFSSTINEDDRELLKKTIEKQKKVLQKEKIDSYIKDADKLFAENPITFRKRTNEINKSPVNFKKENGLSTESMAKIDAYNNRMIKKHNNILLGDFLANPTKTGLSDLKKYNNFTESRIEKLTEIYEESPDYEKTTTYRGFERAISEVKRLADIDTTTVEGQDRLMDESIRVASKIKRSNSKDDSENGISADDMIEMNNTIYGLLNDKVFQERIKDLPSPSVFDSISSSVSSVLGVNSIEKIGEDTMRHVLIDTLYNEGRNTVKIFKDGVEKAIRKKYSDLPEMKGELIPDKTILNVNGKPYLFKGFGAEDIIVEVRQ